MKVTKKVVENFVILTISGRLDMTNVSEIKSIFDKEIEAGAINVAINMSELDYIDSSGIGSFIGLMSKLKQKGGNVFLFGMKPDIHKIFQMTKLLGFFKVFPDEATFLREVVRKG